MGAFYGLKIKISIHALHAESDGKTIQFDCMIL